MTKPVVGVIANAHRIENRFDAQAVGQCNLRAVADVAGALPLVFPGLPDVTEIDARSKRSTASSAKSDLGRLGSRHGANPRCCSPDCS